MRLEKRNAIVTGAGSGIGRAIAIGFAEQGARIVCADVNAATAEEAAEQIRTAGGDGLAVTVDVSCRTEVDAMLQRALEHLDHVDVLVSAAGITRPGSILETTEEDWDRVLAVNLKGLYLCGQVVARHMVECGRGQGSIINVTSQLSEAAQPNSAPYLASKGAGKMLTKAMALDLADQGVRVNALAPGLTRTNLSSPADNDPERYARLLTHIPMGRQAEPREMVGAAVFLASADAAYVTGTTLVVDGGYLTM